MIWLLIACLLWAAPAGAASFADDFTRADNTDVGTSWDSGYTSTQNAQIVSNKVRCTIVFTTECDESVNAPTFTLNQYAQMTIATWNAAANPQYFWLALRQAAPTTITWYQCTAAKNEPGYKTQISRKVAGVETALTNENATTWTASDIMRCEVTGGATTTIKLYRNGSLLLSYADASPITATTRTGFGMYLSTGAVSDLELDNFRSGDIGGSRLLMGVGQ